jgi:hypothetical protein
MDVQLFAFNTFKNNVSIAEENYGKILFMSYIIFAVGISMFLFTSISSLVKGLELYSIAFGSLGIASFVSFFIFSPVSKVQSALSNLLQAEILYMNFWDQIHFWAPLAMQPDIAVKKAGSEGLHKATEKTVKLLQGYLEDLPENKQAPKQS